MKLLPCPACGGETVVLESNPFGNYGARCLKCRAKTEWSSDPEVAMSHWNTGPVIRTETKEYHRCDDSPS